MKRKDCIDKIAKYLARFVEEVKAYNSANLYDINIHAENALIPIFNLVFDLNLVNANALAKKNYPAVDLIDDANRIAFQVTATPTLDKIKGTLDRFQENKLDEKYDTLYIYVLTEKQSSYSETGLQPLIPDGFSFAAKDNIIDLGDLLQRINYIQALDKLETLARLCEHEFSDTQIEQRKKKFQAGYLKNEPEKLYLNFLPIAFPEAIYIADLDVDFATVKARINQRRIDAGMRKRTMFKQGELLWDEMLEKKIYGNDFITRENKLITFRDLYDSNESLTRLIDKGTATRINTEEYYSQSNAYLNNFKHLLRQTLIEFCKAKGLQWINAKEILRFKNHKEVPNIKQIRWKGKKEATKTVIFEMMSKKDKEGNSHIICYRNMAFKPSFVNFGKDWYLVVNPTWSFTNPGGHYPSRFEEAYLSGLKRQENNQAVYYQYRFFGYYLSYSDLFTEQNKYPHLAVNQLTPLNFIPKIEDEKWRPPKEFAPLNEREAELSADKELNNTLFE
ncbi:SMEK domain-containing protein [Flavisolibacter nicotianae]|uniref:SMEK domain-containing protein n=1 Tax=Flavisolibacter nicotianae TaxID=2364882 RepID=UPI0013C4663D|nr:SMEK domain-containing protein [Flavisolibacter nicotianae]